MVTFRQVDPLYVLDLSDPTAPARRRELKIPGYSAYLHPVGRGLLLGVGREVGPGGVPGVCRLRSSTSPIPAAPVRLDREDFGAPRTPRSSTTTTPSPGSTTASLALMPIDAYHGDGTTTHYLRASA